jgi:hypothetical protein
VVIVGRRDELLIWVTVEREVGAAELADGVNDEPTAMK